MAPSRVVICFCLLPSSLGEDDWDMEPRPWAPSRAVICLRKGPYFIRNHAEEQWS